MRPQKFAIYGVLVSVGGRDLRNSYAGNQVYKEVTMPEIRVLETIHGSNRVSPHSAPEGAFRLISSQALFDELVAVYGEKVLTKTFPAFASGEAESLPLSARGPYMHYNTNAATAAVAAAEEPEAETDAEDETEELDLGGLEIEDVSFGDASEPTTEQPVARKRGRPAQA